MQSIPICAPATLAVALLPTPSATITAVSDPLVAAAPPPGLLAWQTTAASKPPAAPRNAATLSPRFAAFLLVLLLLGLPLLLGRALPNALRGLGRLVALHFTLLPGTTRLSLAKAIGAKNGVFSTRDLAATGINGALALFGIVFFVRGRRRKEEIVCRIAGFEFDANTFCRGVLVSGSTGCGKSVCGIVRIVHELCMNCPKEVDPATGALIKAGWGGAIFDYKGELPDELRPTFRFYKREDDLLVLRSRPLDAPKGWIPEARLNLLGDDTIPGRDYANILCDAAMIAEGKKGSGEGNPFFPLAAKDAITKAITLCRAISTLQVGAQPNTPPSERFGPRIDRLYRLLMDRDSFDEAMNEAGVYEPFKAPRAPQKTAEADATQPRFRQSKILVAKSPEAAEVREALLMMHRSYFNIEGETFNSVQRTALNYLAPYMERDILDVFSTDSTVSISQLNEGKIIVVAMPMLYQAQRTYIQIILSQMLFAHAKRRFDLSPADRRKLPINVLFVDEFQKMANDQYGDMDVTRGARFTCVLGTQGVDSLYPVLGKERAEVLLANVRTRIIGQSFNPTAAESDANFLGKREVEEMSITKGEGAPSRSYRKEIKHYHQPHDLQKLAKYNFIVTHPDGRSRKLVLPPLTPDGKIQDWWWSSEVWKSNTISVGWLAIRMFIGRLFGTRVRE